MFFLTVLRVLHGRTQSSDHDVAATFDDQVQEINTLLRNCLNLRTVTPHARASAFSAIEKLNCPRRCFQKLGKTREPP